MTILRLKPRSTRVFENENWIHLQPTSMSAGWTSTGYPASDTIGPDADTLEDGGIVRVRNRGHRPNSLPAVSAAGVGERQLLGERLGNKTFALRGGEVPNFPEFYAALFVDNNDSIIGGGGDGTITVTYDDDGDNGRVDAWQLSVHGKGPHYTSFKVKSITSVVGTGFDAAGGGAPMSDDTLIVGPACADTLCEIVGSSGTILGGVLAGDPNVAGDTPNASYAGATSTSDQRAYVSYPSLAPWQILSVAGITIHYFVGSEAGTTAGIDLLMRFGSGDSDWVIGHSNATNYGTLTPVTISINPSTGNPFTLADLETLELGVNFLGETPAKDKRWAFIRLFVGFQQGFFHPSIDGAVIANQDRAHEVVTKDTFSTPSDDNAQCLVMNQSTDRVEAHVDNLPAEAISVISFAGHGRHTMRNQGDPLGAQAGDTPCGIGTPPRANSADTLSLMDGPPAQSNDGGFRTIIRLTGILSTARTHVGPGDDPAGCGTNGDYPGLDIGFGNFTDLALFRTITSSAAEITVANVNAATVGIDNENNIGQTRTSQLFAKCEYRRKPNGGELYYHLTIDDPTDSPDDSKYMESQHSGNKKFGVDFAGIPEVSQITSVTAICRARAEQFSSAGWRVTWRLGTDGGTDVSESVQFNELFEDKPFSRSLSPFTGLAWTRAEVNVLVVIWEAMGENRFYYKQISNLVLEIDLDLIPEKIDAARDIVSRKLRLLRKPQPFLKLNLPPAFGDVRMLDDVGCIHNAIPRLSATLGFERWDRSLMRLFRKKVNLMTDQVETTFLDVREFLTTLWITGSTRAKGASATGMAVLTPGVSLNFVRTTNDYIRDDFAGQFQELNGGEPPTGIKGILVINGTVNRVVNSAFSEGATDVFTGWTQNIGAGGAIAEDLLDDIWEEDLQGTRPRTVVLTTPTVPANRTFINTTMAFEKGDAPFSPQGSDYAVSVIHKDPSGTPLYINLWFDPPAFGAYGWDIWGNCTNLGDTQWHPLPVRSEVTRDQFKFTLQNAEDSASSPVQDDQILNLNIGVQTTVGHQNRVYGAQVEGGRIADGRDQRYMSNFILTRTGPVVRDGLGFFLANNRARPTYPAEGRGTFGVELETIWNTAQLPRRAGARRYVYGVVVDSFNWDVCYYDCDNEKFVYERRVAGTTFSCEKYWPHIMAGQPVQVATRWISSEGDLDETPFSISIFVGGEQGTTTVVGQKFPLPTQSLLYLGSKDGTDGEMIDAWVRKLEIKQFALPQAAIRRLFT